MNKIDRREHFTIIRPSEDEFKETKRSTHEFYQTQEFISAQRVSVDKKEIGFLGRPFNRKKFIL